MLLIVTSALLALALGLAFRIKASLPDRSRRRLCTGGGGGGGGRKASCLVVLGSGGHTAEMLYDLRSLGSELLSRLELTFLLADTDRGSLAHTEAFEKERGISSAKVARVPRAREVGQSYASSVLTTLHAAWYSLLVVLRLLPDVVFCNGPGTCVPVVVAAYVARVLALKRILVIYSESFACVDHLSLSGRLLYRLADRFTVQWPHLLQSCPLAEYAGRLYSEAEVEPCRTSPALPPPAKLPPLPSASASGEGAALAIVTVGSTRFDALIRAVDRPEFLEALRRLGIKRLKVQYGSGSRPACLEGVDGGGIQVEVVDYTPGLPEEIRRAALVVSHAGAGTILDCLQAGRRLVVVPNEDLMANHQVQLGRALQEQGLLFCLRVGDLVHGLKEADFSKLRSFPAAPGAAFRRCTAELLDLGA